MSEFIQYLSSTNGEPMMVREDEIVWFGQYSMFLRGNSEELIISKETYEYLKTKHERPPAWYLCVGRAFEWGQIRAEARALLKSVFGDPKPDDPVSFVKICDTWATWFMKAWAMNDPMNEMWKRRQTLRDMPEPVDLCSGLVLAVVELDAQREALENERTTYQEAAEVLWNSTVRNVAPWKGEFIIRRYRFRRNKEGYPLPVSESQEEPVGQSEA